MGQEFTSVAKSRARYYCKGAPVQFVQVELLRMADDDSMVVTLMFKNIARRLLTGFTAHFRCKDMQGNVVMEDNFTYQELAIEEGGLFGDDEAVYVSAVPLSSVEVSLVTVQYGEIQHDLQGCRPMPLPALRPLAAQVAEKVNDTLQIDSAHYMPAIVQDGWQCTCGAFNYDIGQGKVMCSECGADKASLLNAVRLALQPETQPEPVVMDEPFLDIEDAVPASAGISDTAEYERVPDMSYGMDYDSSARTAVMPSVQDATAAVSLMRPQTADFILKFLPYITLGASTLYVLIMLLIHLLVG